MSVNAKDRKLLQSMWNKAEAASGSDIPDGTYQFKITGARFHMTDKGKPTFKSKLEIVGGDSEYIGKTTEINDNLETEDNMGWFKRKLRRLNIVVSEDIDDITDGALGEEMMGKVFEGQVKTKNDFVNVYVNRLVGEGAVKPSSKPLEKEEETEAPEESELGFESGDTVTWAGGKKGEIIQIIEEEGLARVRKEDDTVVRVKLELLEKSEASEKEEQEDKEEDKETGEKEEAFELPEASEVEDMSASEVRATLKKLGFDPSEIKAPREVLHGFISLAEDPKGKIELEELSPLASALEVTIKKGSPFKDSLKVLAKAVEARLSGQ